MPPKISIEKKDRILKVLIYFIAESKGGAPFHSVHNTTKRTAHCLKVSESFIKKNAWFRRNPDVKKCINKKDKIDQFDKDPIKTTVHNLYRKNECVPLKKNKTTFGKQIMKFVYQNTNYVTLCMS